MSGEAATTTTGKGSRADAVKKAWSGWWEPPPGTGAYAPIPYVAPIVDPDALSMSQQRVLAVIRRGARKEGTAYLCDPGGYGTIAKKAGVCRKTAYNAIRDLVAKGVLRVFEKRMRGKQRARTLYLAPHFNDVLIAWRADETIFKTDRGSIVVRGRKKRIVTVAEAAEWNMNPATAPRKGSGRARQPDEAEEAQSEEEAKAESQPETLARPAAPPIPAPPGTDERIAAVLGAMRDCKTRPNLKDAQDAFTAAQEGAPGIGADVIVACIFALAAEHTPSARYPVPRPKWIIDRLAPMVHRVDEDAREKFRKVDPEELDPDSLDRFHEYAVGLRASGRATPEEIEKCDYWIARLSRMQAAG